MMRACTRLACALIAALNGCAGTETGNPSFEGQLAYDAYSSDVTAVALRQSDDEPSAQSLVVDSAWLVLGDVRLLRDGECDRPEDAEVSATGIGEGDHAAGGHVVTALSVEVGRYCGVALPFEHAGSIPIAGPPPLAQRSVLIDGALQDGTPFTLASALQEQVVLRADAPFELRADSIRVLIGFDLAVWLGALDWDAAERDASGAIVIDERNNAALSAQFERSLIEGTALFRDRDGSGVARAGDELARGHLQAP